MDRALHSPFANRLGTNYIPSDSDVVHIRDLLTEPRAHVEDVDKEINRITQRLERLQRERQVYQKYIDDHEAVLSPIRRVPLEILQCIFVRCLPTKHNGVMSSQQAPILLTHVFYTSLFPIDPRSPSHIPPYPTPIPPELSDEECQTYTKAVQRWEFKMQERRDIIRTWLTRAAGCKLSLSITLWEGRRNSAEADVANDMIKSIMDIVISFSRQWKRIEVLAAHPHISDLLALPSQSVPYLEHIKVTCNPFSTPPSTTLARYRPVPPDGLLSAPRLTSFHFKLIPEAPLSLPINWSQLTELYFDGAAARNFEGGTLEFTPTDALKLLSSCPLLVRCRLVIVQNSFFSPSTLPNQFNFNPEDDDIPSSIPLHHLEHLSIHEGAPLTGFFSQLEVPKLKEVVFTSSMPPYEEELTSLVTLLKTCGPMVQKLTFDYPCFTAQDIHQSLSLVPNLSHLSLSSNPRVRSFVVHQYDAQRVPASAKFNNVLLAKLTPRVAFEAGSSHPTVTTLCPNLSALSCKFLSPEFTEDALFDFIRARRSEAMYKLGIAPLRKVHVSFKRPRPEKSAYVDYSAVNGVDIVKALELLEKGELKVEDCGFDATGLKLELSYTNPMQKGVESFSPSLGLAPECLVPYLY
ncbi:hypothetical protein NMY22_g2031 [Coprinellus aureogranulatus]|nr:hypothetical protein NMY22_g2031 [Coprinellus aureogranulatus]